MILELNVQVEVTRCFISMLRAVKSLLLVWQPCRSCNDYTEKEASFACTCSPVLVHMITEGHQLIALNFVTLRFMIAATV